MSNEDSPIKFFLRRFAIMSNDTKATLSEFRKDIDEAKARLERIEFLLGSLQESLSEHIQDEAHDFKQTQEDFQRVTAYIKELVDWIGEAKGE